jgi:hypothetical protein
MSRIKVSAKQAILEAVMEATFGPRREALALASRMWSYKVYQSLYDAKERELMEDLSGAYVKLVTKFYVRIASGPENKTQAECSFGGLKVKVPAGHGGDYSTLGVFEWGNPLTEEYEEICGVKKDLASEEAAFKAQPKAVIDAATSYDKLNILWPELSGFIGTTITSPPIKPQMPAVRDMSGVNNIITASIIHAKTASA